MSYESRLQRLGLLHLKDDPAQLRKVLQEQIKQDQEMDRQSQEKRLLRRRQRLQNPPTNRNPSPEQPETVPATKATALSRQDRVIKSLKQVPDLNLHPLNLKAKCLLEKAGVRPDPSDLYVLQPLQMAYDKGQLQALEDPFESWALFLLYETPKDQVMWYLNHNSQDEPDDFLERFDPKSLEDLLDAILERFHWSIRELANSQ